MTFFRTLLNPPLAQPGPAKTLFYQECQKRFDFGHFGTSCNAEKYQFTCLNLLMHYVLGGVIEFLPYGTLSI